MYRAVGVLTTDFAQAPPRVVILGIFFYESVFSITVECGRLRSMRVSKAI